MASGPSPSSSSSSSSLSSSASSSSVSSESSALSSRTKKSTHSAGKLKKKYERLLIIGKLANETGIMKSFALFQFH